MVLLAHSGHWTGLLLYGVPVLIAAGGIALGTLRQRREAALEAGGKPGSGTSAEPS